MFSYIKFKGEIFKCHLTTAFIKKNCDPVTDPGLPTINKIFLTVLVLPPNNLLVVEQTFYAIQIQNS